mgnify:CR=1 FL=1
MALCIYDGFMKKKSCYDMLDIVTTLYYDIIVLLSEHLSAPTAMRLLSHCSLGTHIIMQATVKRMNNIL